MPNLIGQHCLLECGIQICHGCVLMYCGLVHQQQVGLSVFYRDERGAHMELDPDTSRSIIQQATRISTTLLELLSRDSRSKATIKCDYTTTSFRPSKKGQKNGTRRDRHQGMVPCWEDFSVTDAAQHTYSLRVRIVMEEYNGGPHAAEDGPLPSSVELEVLGASASKWLPARLLATPSLPSEEDTRLMTACGKVRGFVYDNISQWTPAGMRVAKLNPNLWCGVRTPMHPIPRCTLIHCGAALYASTLS